MMLTFVMFKNCLVKLFSEDCEEGKCGFNLILHDVLHASLKERQIEEIQGCAG